MTAVADELGMSIGFALDLRTNKVKGVVWDFSKENMRREALRLQDEVQPWLLMLFPTSTPF